MIYEQAIKIMMMMMMIIRLTSSQQKFNFFFSIRSSFSHGKDLLITFEEEYYEMKMIFL